VWVLCCWLNGKHIVAFVQCSVIRNWYEAFTWTACVINWTNLCLVLFHRLCVHSARPKAKGNNKHVCFLPSPSLPLSLISPSVYLCQCVCMSVCAVRVEVTARQRDGRCANWALTHTHTLSLIHTQTETPHCLEVFCFLPLTYVSVPGLSHPKQNHPS